MEPTSELVRDYVRRVEEEKILEQVEIVRRNRSSRAVLLYGVGGVGKTKLVRALAAQSPLGDDVRWIRPVDVDDSNFWLLENLQRSVAEQLDPDQLYFEPFLTHLARMPNFVFGRVGRDTVATHHRRMREAFLESYGRFVSQTDKTVVITLDTVETIRSMHLLASLCKLIKDLPQTLFILSGRPDRGWEGKDTIVEYLEDPEEGIETATLELTGFGHDDAMTFLDTSAPGDLLSDRDKERLVYLTAGHPLWLALAVDYLCHLGPPPELSSDAESDLVRDEFRTRLITPYRSTGFWPEAIKRLAVLRHSVDKVAWQRLMRDRELPPGAKTWSQAWQQLCAWPWIRLRANETYVTLHDAFAEELAARLIPVHDFDGSWRKRLWRTAAEEYERLIGDQPAEVRRQLTEIFDQDGEPDEATLHQVDELDIRKRDLDQRRTTHLHYLLLSDFEEGTEQFDRQFTEAAKADDLQFQELVCHELEQFLPVQDAPERRDAMGSVVEGFRTWLVGQPVRYVEIGLNIARFLIYNSQPEPALSLLDRLPENNVHVGTDLRYRMANERGNAFMRVPDEVEKAGEEFRSAERRADDLPPSDRDRHLAQAFNELGFYFRNIGNWREADKQYKRALQQITRVTGPSFPTAHREELASIQTHWAYLKALQGEYDEARTLVTEAIQIRRDLGREHGVAVSLSVAGEVQRYHRRFTEAWGLYQQSEATFVRLRDWGWMGLVMQEQAICLFQAHQAGQDIVDEPAEEAKRLIARALDICRDQAVRWYPSALNRAGRIFGAEDPGQGLTYLEESIDEARRIADGWFLSASLIEYLELSYRAWTVSGEARYRGHIDERAAQTRETITRHGFKDFKGRWELLQGHLAVRDSWDAAIAGGAARELDRAITHYSKGFSLLANGQVGSYGLESLRAEFTEMAWLYRRLPPAVQTIWRARLRSDWHRSDLLLDQLERILGRHA